MGHETLGWPDRPCRQSRNDCVSGRAAPTWADADVPTRSAGPDASRRAVSKVDRALLLTQAPSAEPRRGEWTLNRSEVASEPYQVVHQLRELRCLQGDIVKDLLDRFRRLAQACSLGTEDFHHRPRRQVDQADQELVG